MSERSMSFALTVTNLNPLLSNMRAKPVSNEAGDGLWMNVAGATRQAHTKV